MHPNGAAHDYKNDREAGYGVAVGIWRGRMVCYSHAACGEACATDLHTWARDKCAQTPIPRRSARATWHQHPFNDKLAEYERDRQRAAAGALDAAALTDLRVHPLACDGNPDMGERDMCREYLRLLAISALPPACQQIIDTLVSK
jgi:hypothetical protein